MSFIWNSTVYIASTIASLTVNTYNYLTSPPKRKKRKEKETDKIVAGPSNRGTSGELYAFRITGDTYKVGKSVNTTQRVRAYKTIHHEGYVSHTVKCNDIHHSERILHDMLKMRGYHTAQEIFSVPGKTLIVYMEFVSTLDKILNNSQDRHNLAKITQLLRK